MQFFSEPHINFVGVRRFAYVLSGAALLGTAILLLSGTLKGGVDFTGGHLVQVRFEGTSVHISDVRALLEEAGVGGSEVQTFGDVNELLIRVPLSPEGAQERLPVEDIILESYAGNAEITRVEDVGPKIGSELRGDAIRAVLWALVLLLIYISWRFELRFAVGAIVALAHDVLITLGAFAISGREIGLPVVAALLTIVGYSLNDTIVVFDRIREQLRLMRREAFEHVVNLSINRSLSRTIITSLTTLIVVLILYLFGGRVINDFAFALLVGVIVGTYSSVFVASPVVIEWHRYITSRKKSERKKGAR
jgi:preprotein translocase SecF subunit